ncbi:MAG: hypothetical protein GX128_10265 [Bacteroidales bacterium]|jgi:hypothetical protein|nr:hypothetical protein [Bacteroidales bacterium]
MKIKPTISAYFALVLLFLNINFSVQAWNEHTLLAYAALKDLPFWKTSDSIAAKSLKVFLSDNEKELELFLAQHETWSRDNLPNYAPCPDALAFKETGNPDDILLRFYSAIRINQNLKAPLYLQLMPGVVAGGRTIVDPQDITTLEDLSLILDNIYILINEGELVSPFEVLCTANNEPDYGLDLGLFVDNSTDFGKTYGFGVQPFGNPNLEYSSQAPFHMCFFHEAGILYKFGPFLKRTYVDYRLNLYKALSEFAFAQNEDYWGWRFMGWGMHYVSDPSMPYHSKPLPGVSVLRMLWINFKAIIGFPGAKDRAVQLVSNRHTALEEFQVQILRKAFEQQDWEHPFLQALTHPQPHTPFDQKFLIEVVSKEASEKSVFMDKTIKKYMPYKMVSDPKVEASELPDIKRIVEVMRNEKGQEAVDAMTLAIAERFKSFSMITRSFMASVAKV